VITIGYPGPLYLLTFASRGRQQAALGGQQREVVGDAVARVLDEGAVRPEELAVLVDDGRSSRAVSVTVGSSEP
jgi:hypothetical protein